MSPSLHDERTTYRLAAGAVMIGATLNSFGGLLLRTLEEAGPWQVVCYRSGAVGIVMLGLLVYRSRGGFLRALIGASRWTLLGGVLLASANTFLILALDNTTVANALFILSGVPFFTALLARVLLKERLHRVTMLSMAVAVVGMTIIVHEGLASAQVLGNVFAMLCGLSFSCFVVLLRSRRATDMLPTLVLGGFIACVVAGVAAGGSLRVPLGDALVCIAWGGGLNVVSQMLFWRSARHVPSAELTLLTMTEFVLGPLWVWLGVGERASTQTLVGGTLVMVAVAVRAFAGASVRRPTRGA